jgi:hypothetical protein
MLAPAAERERSADHQAIKGGDRASVRLTGTALATTVEEAPT